MLIDFEVENFRSYSERKRFSMVASSSVELPQNLILVPDLDLKLVRSAALYGPNASGKSNLLAAMNFISESMLYPATREGVSDSIQAPFGLARGAESKPGKFRVRFLINGILHDYSLSVRQGIIEDERLAVFPNGRPQEWFERVGQDIKFSRTHLKGQKEMLKGVTDHETPFLAVAAAFSHSQLTEPADWLFENLGTRFDTMEPGHRSSRRRLQFGASAARLFHVNRVFREWANAFLRHADLGIKGIEIEVTEERLKRPVAQKTKDGKIITIVKEVTEQHHEPFFIHAGESGVTARMAISEESQGTRRLFGILVPLFEVLDRGQVAVIDEFSASLHPSLVREIVRIFHDPERNPKNAQLVFATHDTNLLSGSFFRRDQVWFTEKNSAGATDLYSLQDIKGITKDESLEKGYLRGRYGAIPFFSEFDFPPLPNVTQEEPTTG
jgi:predicted ATPase